MSGDARWSGKSKGTPLGYLIFVKVIRTIGIRAAYAMLHFVAPWYLLTAKTGNAALRIYFRNLREHFPEIKGISAHRSYLTFGRILIDQLAVQAGLARKFNWSEHGKEHLAALMASGKGGMLISAHVGNWELASHVLKDFPGRMSVVLLSAEDERIQRVIDRNLTTTPYDTIPLSADLSHVFQMNDALNKGHVLCMHGDRSLTGARVKRMRFLGKEADFPVGPFAFAAAHKVPVCFSFVVSDGTLRYKFTCTEPLASDTPLEALMERYVRELEAVVRKYPLQWFNYFDFWAHGRTAG